MYGQAKTVCLSLLYGGGLQTVAQQLQTTVDEAVKFRQQFNEAFPEIAGFVKETNAFATKYGFVTTLLGRV